MAELTDVDSKESITETIKAKLLMGGLRNMFSQLHDAIAEVETDGSVTQRLVEDLMDAQEAIDMVLGQLQVVQDMFPEHACCEHAECDEGSQCSREGCCGSCHDDDDAEPAAVPGAVLKTVAVPAQPSLPVLKEVRKPSKKAKAAKPSEPSGNAGPIGMKSTGYSWRRGDSVARHAEYSDFSCGSTSKVFGRI